MTNAHRNELVFLLPSDLKTRCVRRGVAVVVVVVGVGGSGGNGGSGSGSGGGRGHELTRPTQPRSDGSPIQFEISVYDHDFGFDQDDLIGKVIVDSTVRNETKRIKKKTRHFLAHDFPRTMRGPVPCPHSPGHLILLCARVQELAQHANQEQREPKLFEIKSKEGFSAGAVRKQLANSRLTPPQLPVRARDRCSLPLALTFNFTAT